MSWPDERIVVTVETPEMPGNDEVAAEMLREVVRLLHERGVYPTRLALEVTTAPTT